MPETPFRSFSPGDFYATSSWLRLADILKGNGGCYGLYGPRGAGKSWLMLRAIAEANGKRGLGLWFPCPSHYDPSEFLAALADNLAKAIERRFLPGHAWTQAIRGLRLLLASIAGVSVIVSVVAYLVRDTTGKGGRGTIFSAIPGHVWLAAEIAVGLLAALYIGQLAWNSRPAGRLAREATALRERIRYTASLKLGTEITVGAGSSVTGSLRRARERELDERPTTVASLVFDFRNLAELMAEIVPGPVRHRHRRTGQDR